MIRLWEGRGHQMAMVVGLSPNRWPLESDSGGLISRTDDCIDQGWLGCIETSRRSAVRAG